MTGMTGTITASQVARNKLARIRAEKQALLDTLAREAEHLEKQKQRDQRAKPQHEPEVKARAGATREEMRPIMHILVGSRLVKKRATTLDALEKRGQLAKDLRIAFDAFARHCARATGAVVDDRDPRGSSARMGSQWEGSIGGGFGTRTPSDASLDSARVARYVTAEMPDPFQRLLAELVEEHISDGPLIFLKTYGHERGFAQEQQARAAGAVMAWSVCVVVQDRMKRLEALHEVVGPGKQRY